jgi:hypothetical protein
MEKVMKNTSLRPVLTKVALLLAITMMVSACVDNDKSWVVQFNIMPEYTTEECTWETDPEEFISSGLMDLSMTSTYVITPQVHNYLINTSNDYELNSMDIQIEYATIRYEWLKDRNGVLTTNYPTLMAIEEEEVRIPISGITSAAGDATTPGVLLMHVNIVPHHIGKQLQAIASTDIVDRTDLVLGAHFKLHGTTTGGTSMETNDFLYPIYFCSGCLDVICCPEDLVAEPPYYPACRYGQDGLEACESGDEMVAGGSCL